MLALLCAAGQGGVPDALMLAFCDFGAKNACFDLALWSALL
jgi:hypothetical protein